MLATERGRYIMSDAWVLYEDAIEMLEQGRTRSAAVALILERTSEEPERTTQTSSSIRLPGRQSDEPGLLHSRYPAGVSQLHGDCFIYGHCEPEDYFGELIRDTADYIRDAEKLVGGPHSRMQT